MSGNWKSKMVTELDRLRTDNARLVARNGVLENAQAACLGERDDALARLREAEKLLAMAPIWAASQSWLRDRDAFLNHTATKEASK